jgi:hypothetical protein
MAVAKLHLDEFIAQELAGHVQRIELRLAQKLANCNPATMLKAARTAIDDTERRVTKIEKNAETDG